MIGKLFILLLLTLVHGGRVFSGDLAVDYANAGKMTQLSFTFMLSNSITSDDYLKVALPFPFHSQLTPAVPAMEGLSSPSLLTVTYQTIDPLTQALGTAFNTFVLTETIDSSNYYIRFYDVTRLNLVAIPSGTWYKLTFKILDSNALQYQMSSSILQIQVSTVSSVWTNAMVYDDNLAFQYFQLASSPANLITLSVTPSGFTGTNGFRRTQATYQLLLDSTLNIPSYQFTETLILKYLFSDSRFRWDSTSNCLSVAKTTSPTIAALDPSLYTCTFDTTNNILVVSLTPDALALQTIFRFQVGVINPSVVVSSADVEVRAMKTTESTIMGYGLMSGAVTTNAIYVTYHEIFVGWGLRPDALLPFQPHIYRGNSATPTYMPYNSLTVKFSISQSTSSALELKVVIGIPSESSAFVLGNAFIHNLPAFPNKMVRCQVESASNTTGRSIGCTGVGQLSVNTVYSIGWKMFFPYDNYQSAINCTQFGTVRVLSMQTITNIDNAFYLGRGERYLDYLKTLSNVKVIGRNSSYITYMQTFFNLNLIVRSKDFQEFLQMPQNIIINNRPKDYVNKIDGYEDVYVVSQNLAFLTYMGLFSDIYIAARLKDNSDIVKGYDTIPLVSLSVPKNTLTLTSVNSKDWTDYSTAAPLVSTDSSGTQTIASSGGLKRAGTTSQSIIFNLKALYSDITNYSSTINTVLNNSAGLLIMMNPMISITSGSTITLQQSVGNDASVSTRGYTINNVNAYNNYTYLQFLATRSQGLYSTFVPTTAVKKAFSFFPVKLDEYSSMYANNYNMDIYMAAADGVNGPLNRLQYNSYFLINSFTQTSTAMPEVTLGFVNYYASSTAANQLDGSKVPTMIKIKGAVPAGSTTNLKKIAVFFDNLTPFFANLYTNEVYCFGTDAGMNGLCDYRPGAGTLSEKNNYNTLSRVEIPVTTPATTFTVYIPVIVPLNKQISYTYFGLLYQNTSSSDFPLLQYITTMQTSTTYVIDQVITNSGCNFGPTVNTATAAVLGSSKNDLIVSAAYTSGGITANAVGSIGAAFTFFSKWDLFRTSQYRNWPLSSDCYKVTYLQYSTNYFTYIATTGTTFVSSYENMTGVVCSVDTTSGITTASINVSTVYLPSGWGKTIPGYGSYSTNTGRVVAMKNSFQLIGTLPNIMTSIRLPVVGPSMRNALTYWDILLPVDLPKSVQITVDTGSSSINLPFEATPSTTATCSVYTRATSAGTSTKLAIPCSIVTAYTTISYTLDIKEKMLFAGSYLTIYHFGMTTTTTNNTVNVSITCYSLASTSIPSANDIIFQTVSPGLDFTWNPAGYPGSTSLTLSEYTLQTYNKGVVSPFKLTFSLVNKGLYNTERIRINLGQYATDNQGSTLSPTCVVFEYSSTGAEVFTHDFAAVDSSQNFTNLELWPKYHLFSPTLKYTVKCYNFLTASSSNPTSMSALVVNTSADLTGYSASNSVVLASLTALTTSSTGTVAKNFLTPGSQMQMSFTFSSIGIDYNSILFIGFPSYYSNGLGPDIKCYIGSVEIFCSVFNRQLTVKYMGVYASGTSFTVIVIGVSQPINYNSGTFSYKFDLNNNINEVNVAGTFSDTVSSTVLQIQNFPNIRIVQFTQSSSLIRDTDVTVTFQFYLASSLKTISVGQQLILNFPPIFNDILRFATPTCTLTLTSNVLKNYINTCSARGLRLKMPLIDTLVLGSSYRLTVSGLINPTAMSPYFHKYYIEIADSANSNIVIRSFSPLCNYEMPVFTTDSNKIYLNYYNGNDQIINTVNTYANIQSSPVYVSASAPIASSTYNRNIYLTSSSSAVLTIPQAVYFVSGSNPTGVTFSATNNGIQYIYMRKSGDGTYYSNLPPLTLITDLNYLQALSVVTNAFNIPVQPVGSNYTVIVTLPTHLMPVTSVNMTVTIQSGTGLALNSNPFIITFYSGQPSATIGMSIDDGNLWVVGRTSILTLTPSSGYSGTAAVTLVCVAAQTGTPTATIVATTTAGQYKSYAFNAQCSQNGYFFYHIERVFTYNTTACDLDLALIKSYALASSTAGLRVTETYFDCQDKFGIIYIPTVNTNTPFTVSNLQTSTAYKITGFCQNSISATSALVTTTFYTASNTGSITQATFTFNKVLTVQQKIKLVCYLALQFNINYQKVSTYDGYYCSELLNRRRRRLWEEPEVATATDFKKVIVYFGISTGLMSDTSAAAITTATAAGNTTLKDKINTEIVGMANLISYTPSTSAYMGSHNLVAEPFVDVGSNYVYVYDMRLPNNGLIYVIIGDQTLWSRDPIVSELKVGSGPNGLPPVYFQVLAYRTADSMSGYFAYTSLPQGVFNLYIAVSDQNPFDTARFSAIRKYEIKNEVPSYGIRLAMALLLLLVALL